MKTSRIKEAWIFLKNSPRLHGVVILVAVLAFFYFTWMPGFAPDRTITGQPKLILWGQYDVYGFFSAVSVFEARIVEFTVRHIFGGDIKRFTDTLCNPEVGSCITISWDCTGLKQLLEFFFIILLYPACHKKKLWYIPAGLVILFGFNIIRLLFVYSSGKGGFEAMDNMHHIFKFLYNGLIFLFWLIWNEFVYSPSFRKR